MKKKNYELRVCPEVMNKLQGLALRLAYERGRKETWASLMREGAELLLKAHAQPSASAAPVTTKGGSS